MFHLSTLTKKLMTTLVIKKKYLSLIAHPKTRKATDLKVHQFQKKMNKITASIPI